MSNMPMQGRQAAPPPRKNYDLQRDRLIERYEKTGRPYQQTTKPYKSTGQVQFDVVDFLPAGAAIPSVAHAVARKGQRIEFFSYGIGDQIPYGPGPATRIATEADTNLSKARNTNGVESFVIEGISSSFRSVRVKYDRRNFGPDLVLADAAVIAAYDGLAPMADPAAIVAPPQVGSPFNLESTMGEAVKPHLSIEFEWDRSRIIKIGTMEEIPEGAAKSYLRASGDPRTDNRFRCPEGYAWEHQGLPDSEFVVRAVLQDDVVMPISLIGLGGANAPTAVTARALTHLFLDLTLRLHGTALSYPSRN